MASIEFSRAWSRYVTVANQLLSQSDVVGDEDPSEDDPSEDDPTELVTWVHQIMQLQTAVEAVVEAMPDVEGEEEPEMVTILRLQLMGLSVTIPAVLQDIIEERDSDWAGRMGEALGATLSHSIDLGDQPADPVPRRSGKRLN